MKIDERIEIVQATLHNLEQRVWSAERPEVQQTQIEAYRRTAAEFTRKADAMETALQADVDGLAELRLSIRRTMVELEFLRTLHRAGVREFKLKGLLRELLSRLG